MTTNGTPHATTTARNARTHHSGDTTAVVVPRQRRPHQGDAHQIPTTRPAGTAQNTVTSPPHWANRDYSAVEHRGHAPNPTAHAETLRPALHQVHGVLADDQPCWRNPGDAYAVSSDPAPGPHRHPGRGLDTPGTGVNHHLPGPRWLVTLTLQDNDGWFVGDATVNHQPNAITQPVPDRLNHHRELIFLLVPSRQDRLDLDPIRLPYATSRPARHRASTRGSGTTRPAGTPATRRHPGNGKPAGTRHLTGTHTRNVIAAGRYDTGRRSRGHPNSRHLGDAGHTRRCRGPRLAASPIDLSTRRIQPGGNPGGTMPDRCRSTGTTSLAALAAPSDTAGARLPRQTHTGTAQLRRTHDALEPSRRFTSIEANPTDTTLAAQSLPHAAEADTGNGDR